jgi:hypothetical protein
MNELREVRTDLASGSAPDLFESRRSAYPPDRRCDCPRTHTFLGLVENYLIRGVAGPRIAGFCGARFPLRLAAREMFFFSAHLLEQ